jgi:hypothetical protein
MAFFYQKWTTVKNVNVQLLPCTPHNRSVPLYRPMTSDEIRNRFLAVFSVIFSRPSCLYYRWPSIIIITQKIYRNWTQS